MEPPHSGVELAKRVHDLLIDWGIEKKVFSITLDNASANDVMQNLLKERLNFNNDLLCNGEFFHVRCCAHILNLIVQEGMKVASDAMHKIRESIRYVRQSEARKIVFKRCIEQVEVPETVSLKLDVPTRWNSTHAMLESALKYRRAFANLAFNDTNYPHCPTNEEWARAEAMCKFLKPFAVITNLMSGSTYPTSNMYFNQISKIESMLKHHMHNDDSVIRDMAVRMLDKFEKYWDSYSVILSLAIILDPRMKFDIVKFSYSRLDPTNCHEKVEYVRSKLYSVFNEYKNLVSSSSPTHIVQTESSYNARSIHLANIVPPNFSVRDQSNYLDAFDDYLECKSKDSATIEKSELDYYLEEATLDPTLFVNLQVLDYWKSNSSRFPCLAKMACDILSIPITTVASESAFSIGSRVLTKYRSSLLPDNVQALICTRNWILGFPFSEDDPEEEIVSINPEEASFNASSVPPD
ncbi:zinc finger BED domain-containing protein RICESLEEPER 2-like [Neltuma alba]|uniref:zinc finger BED domain-containing protein RICESLEEPER 2-like n=1 Tax=Neltuma alba TaxID=207710 RepID=UPI0010A314E3|nr:zinc finger BED domain-containing protein RICESLEEPER 2-like [Prosopis alba]